MTAAGGLLEDLGGSPGDLGLDRSVGWVGGRREQALSEAGDDPARRRQAGAGQ